MQQISYGEEDTMAEAVTGPRLAFVLLLDSSGSMGGSIDNLNSSVNSFRDHVCADPVSMNTVDIAVVGFNDDAFAIQDFSPIASMKDMHLEARGKTSTGKAIGIGLDMLEERVKLYKDLGVPHFKPWVFLISDDEPSDRDVFKHTSGRLKDLIGMKMIRFYAVGIEGYDRGVPLSLTDRAIELGKADYTSIFEWLAESIVKITNSCPREEAVLSVLPHGARKAAPDRDVSEWD